MRGACIQCAQLSLTSAETEGWEWCDWISSFDNSTCKRVLDLLEPGDLRLGQVVIKRVAVVKLGVNNVSGDGGSCFWYQGMDGYSEGDKKGNSKIWRQMRSGQKK